MSLWIFQLETRNFILITIILGDRIPLVNHQVVSKLTTISVVNSRKTT